MKYDLIPKRVLDEACEYILQANKRIKVIDTDDKEPIIMLDRAYSTIQHNRTQCNVQPESRD